MNDLRTELEMNEQVRRAFRASLRQEPESSRQARVQKAIKQFEDDGDL
jgi:hypothetical protein